MYNEIVPDLECSQIFLMSIGNINIEELLASVKNSLEKDKTISKGLKASIEMLMVIVGLLVNRLGLNSQNSSTPPSVDPNRTKKKKAATGKKPGGQPGHKGRTLEKIYNPDEIQELKIDRRTLPKGKKYKKVEPKTRQVFEIIINRVVIEYQAEVLEDEDGKQYVASFPEVVDGPVQYGERLKAHSVYLSQYQLLPVDRVREYFQDQVGIPLSKGSIGNFNKEAFKALEPFEVSLKEAFIGSNVVNADETGININGKRVWLHGNSNEKYTYLMPHSKRGKEAMDEMGVLPNFQGKLCYDHWKPYFQYKDMSHVLCNAHHLRELNSVWEQDKQAWGHKMHKLLLDMNKTVNEAGGMLEESEAAEWRRQYRKIIKEGAVECPPAPPGKNKDGTISKRKPKQSDARNLLERLRDFESETLEFLIDPDVPFTNNLGERDIRMTKVQQKISGCFRSFEGAQIFCRIRPYLSSGKKNDISASEALSLLFAKKCNEPIFGAG